jgi:pimeloyl-ACP methyl ester carboxylesterase
MKKAAILAAVGARVLPGGERQVCGVGRLMSGGGLRFLRGAVIAAAIAGVAAYVAVLVLLLANERDLLFIRGRYARARDPVYQAHTIAERDGTRVTIWEAPPRRAGGASVVFFYGNAGTLSDFARIGEALHDEGYGIVLASYRGYPGNTGSPSEDGVMTDARAILATLGPGPVVLWGQSLGTGVAARMAAEGRGAALILQSPYTAVADVAARRFPIFPVHWLMRDRFDTAALVPKIAIPVLIMSGTDDRTVPFDMGETLARLLGRRATFVPFEGGGHELPEWGVQAVAERWLRARPLAP